MTTTNPSSAYFDQVATKWDSLRSGYFTEALRDEAIARAYLRSDMVVADVGGGTGFMTSGLAPLVQKVHILDGSPAMIEEARKNLAAQTNVEYHLSDASHLSLPDASVDAVFANMYLHHCPDPLVAIQEMARLLKPGGRLVISDMKEHDHSWMKTEMADLWLGFTDQQIRSWFGEADLVNWIVKDIHQTCCADSLSAEGNIDQANIGLFIATASRRQAMRDAVRGVYGSRAIQGGSCCGEPSQAGITGEPVEQPNAVSKKSCCSKDPDDINQQVNFVTDYSATERESVPAEADEISLGCGNPTAMANLKPGEIVLDIGSGGGMDSFLASKRVGETGYIIGVDMTPAMVNRARTTAIKSGITNVEFRLGQAEALPVEANSVDVILSNCVINLCEDKGQVFREAFRVLKPGGRLEVSDMVTDGTFSHRVLTDSGEWSGCVAGALPEKEYLDLISEAGFSAIRTKKSTRSGKVDDVNVFSVIVSAEKPGGSKVTRAVPSCGCGSGCCS